MNRDADRAIESSGPPAILTALDAVRAVQRTLCGESVAPDAATAEGIALTGRRAASVAGGGADGGLPDAGTASLPASCVHHLTRLPGGPPAIVLVASTAPQAIDDALLGHALSERLGRAVVSLVPEPLASELALATLPGPEALSVVETALGRGDALRLLEGVCPSRLDGDPAASLAFVAAGPEAAVLPRQDARVITLRTLAPLPERFLVEALRGVERMIVVGAATHVAPQLARLTDDGCSVEVAPSIPPAAETTEWTHRLSAAPRGAFAEAILRAATASLSDAPGLQIAPRFEVSDDIISLAFAAQDGLDGLPTDLTLAPTEAAALEADLPLDGALLIAGDAEAAVAALRAVRTGDTSRLTTRGALLPDPSVTEVDFRPDDPRPTWPVKPDAPEPAAVEAARRFHILGPDHGDPGPSVPHRPAAATPHLARLRAEPPAPIVVSPRGASSVARELAAALQIAPSRALSDNIPRLAWRAMLAVSDGPMDLREAIRRVGADLIAELGADAEITTQLDAVVAALPGDARTVAMTPELTLDLTLQELLAARRAGRAALREGISRTAEALRDRLLNDRLAGPEGRSSSTLTASLGGLAGRMKPGVLAGSLPDAGGTSTYSPERHAQLESALSSLDRWLGGDLSVPLVSLVRAEAPAGEPARGDMEVSIHGAPLAVAAGIFDGYAERIAPVLAALDAAGRELAGPATLDVVSVGPKRSWDHLGRDELALLPAVLVHLPDGPGGDVELSALPALLRSARPVHVLLDGPLTLAREDGALTGYHTDPGVLAVAHREAGVLQTVLSSAGHLVDGLRRVAIATRPEVILVRRPWDASLPSCLAAAVAVAGRACPVLVYDPDAGDSWAERLDLSGNPEPERAWPTVSLPVRPTEDDGEGEGEGEETLELQVTWADAAALDAAAARQVRAIGREAWADEQLPLSDWVDRARPGAESPGVPYIWLLGDGDVLVRGVVSQQLALACRDHHRAWRVAQELGGFDNVYARRAAEAARAEALAEAQAEREAMEQAHVAALEETRSETARAAIGELAQRLMGLDVAGAAALASSAVAAPAPSRVAPEAAPVDASSAAAETSAPEPEDDDDGSDDGLDEAYIDTILCTSCNDCRNINPELFLYNADKQAYLGDLDHGSYLEMVRAAEVCPAGCIHPGLPLPGDPTGTDAVIARARAIFAPGGAA